MTGEIAAFREITGVRMDRGRRKSAPFADAIREVALRRLAEPAEA